jgi:hypothetical protein
MRALQPAALMSSGGELGARLDWVHAWLAATSAGDADLQCRELAAAVQGLQVCSA